MEKLRKCQKNAIDAFEQYYYIEEENNRGIISMCCGAGKTRTTYEIIKKCINNYDKNFFILATSRKELIYQVAKDYIKWNNIEKFKLNVKIVGGSGEKYKEMTLSTEDNIKDAIKAITIQDKEPLIIITTYASSFKIINAINGKSDLYPELVILDEAHNTTGDNEKSNQELIKKDNDKFNSQKYLFITATPVQLIMKNENCAFQNKETTFSMNNKYIYGNIIYEYSFSDGIKDKIIVDFETIYYTKKDDLPEELINEFKNKSKEEKQNIYFRTIANFLVNIISEKKIKHILVYCGNQKKMKLIEKWVDKAIKNKNKNKKEEEKEKYNILSMIGEDSKRKRIKTMEEYRNNKTDLNILLSVSIFDEGIDETCIDAVMFAEERNTESRIVQNIGRCLRTNQDKKIGYVIIPNIVYEIDSENDKIDTEINLSKNYSSHYKQIRYVISKLKKNIKNNFYKKLVKGDMPDISDEEENDKIDLCDKFLKENNIINKREEINDDNINDLSKFYKQEGTFGDISNERLEQIKLHITKNKIDTIKKWSDFSQKNKLPYLFLHNEFKTEWICWGQILSGVTYSYDEAKQLFRNELVNKFKNSVEWVEYYNKILENELLDDKNDKDNKEEKIDTNLLNKIIKIPNRPQEYYKGEWIDWNDFLGLNNIQYNAIIKDGTCSIDTKAEKNINILVNSDHQKVKYLSLGEFNDIDISKEDKDSIKKYIDEALGINSVLQGRVSTKKNGTYDKCCIQCRIKGSKNLTPPIVIYPEENKYKYDPLSIHNINNIADINRNKEIYIQNKKIINLFEKIINDFRDIVKKDLTNRKNEKLIIIDKKDTIANVNVIKK